MIVPVDALSSVIVPDAAVKSVMFAVLIVVVARVEVPVIRRVPDAERSPCGVAKNLRFSVHDDPFQ